MKNEQLKIEEYIEGYVGQKPIRIINDYLESLTPTIDIPPKRVDYIKRELMESVYAVVEDYKNRKVNNAIPTITIAEELDQYKNGNNAIPTITIAEELENLAKGIRYSDKVVHQRSLDVADALTALSWTLEGYARLEKEFLI